MKELMTGNEAVARGAYEAGVIFASAYPGTPSTEILENIAAKYRDDMYCEWAPNEKVAVEAAIGAAIAGGRALACMKHVGVNVAADPLMTFGYTGTTGGFVIVSADDPGMHSSQNEQDNRFYAKFAKIPMLEPSDSQEAKDFIKLAYDLSEKWETPVFFRMTTRVCHSKSVVQWGERQEVKVPEYVKQIQHYVATPANARPMRAKVEQRLAVMAEYANSTPLNHAEYNGREIGVISSGVAYQYAREVFGEEASYLKLGFTHPMPMDLIREFAGKVKTLYVVEELEPYIESHLKEAGIACIGKAVIPNQNELDTDRVRKAVFGIQAKTITTDTQVPGRPPTLCAGCPHRGFFYSLSKRKDVMVTGDIGCYTLGSAEPLFAIDTTICMGASISTGHGASKVFEKTQPGKKVVAVIGDSTFFHSGVTSLMDIAYNNGSCVSVILDNRTTGMTGHQQNPGTGLTLMGEEAPEVDIPALCKAMGIKEKNIYIVNPLNLAENDAALDQALACGETSVIITKWPCVLKKFSREDKERFDLSKKTCYVDQEACRNCKLCIGTGCPALYAKDGKVHIDQDACNGCGVCMQVCPFDAIKMADGKAGAKA